MSELPEVVCKDYGKQRLCTIYEWQDGKLVSIQGGFTACSRCRRYPKELDKELCAGCLNNE